MVLQKPAHSGYTWRRDLVWIFETRWCLWTSETCWRPSSCRNMTDANTSLASTPKQKWRSVNHVHSVLCGVYVLFVRLMKLENIDYSITGNWRKKLKALDPKYVSETNLPELRFRSCFWRANSGGVSEKCIPSTNNKFIIFVNRWQQLPECDDARLVLGRFFRETRNVHPRDVRTSGRVHVMGQTGYWEAIC